MAKALGRGLGAILDEVEEAYAKDFSETESLELEANGAYIEDLDIKSIVPNPYQPRKYFDESALEELSASIKEHGLLQPIVVVAKEDGYILVAGERRLRAHKLAELPTIKAIVAPVAIDTIKLRELALIENIQRENLNAIELANSYAELIEIHQITHEELSRIVHKSRSQITNAMRLLVLSAYAQKKVASGKISQGHAKVLVGLDEKQQKIIIDSIIGQKLSVRDAEKMAKSSKKGLPVSSPKNVSAKLLEKHKKTLKKLLPFEHKIKAKSIEISFSNEKDIQNFLTFLKKD
jgi:ParB family chromosome partitioning protein